MMVDRYPPRHGEFHDIDDDDDGQIRDWNPQLTEGDAMGTSGMIIGFLKPGEKCRIEKRFGRVVIKTPTNCIPTVELNVTNEEVPQLIADLKRAIGDTDDSDRVRIDRPDSDSGGGPVVPADDAGQRGESGGPGT